MKIKCPHCGSEDNQGTTGIIRALNVNWDGEQGFACLNPKCHKEFVAIFILKGTITLEDSSVFLEEE